MSGYSPRTGVQAVAAAGTAEALVTDKLLTYSVSIQAEPTNTGNMFIGDVNVDSANGIVLAPGQSVSIPGPEIHGMQYEIDLAQVYVDAATSGDEVRFIYLIKVT